ncbi:MAG TPA: hypothetical protein VFA39_18275 [Steroidobacteraceae bacterium]|nr:hypothetical protein [Steroidobacteraceae bacterium]
MSRVSSAAAAPSPVALGTLPSEELLDEELLFADTAGVLEAAAGGTPTIAPASAPASAFSRSVSALDAGSDAACFAGGSLDSSVLESALAVAAVPAGAALFDDVAARDCASAAEKSSVTAVGVVVVLVEEVEVAADARVACRPDRESPVGLSDRRESFVGDLELAELEPPECELAECEPPE